MHLALLLLSSGCSDYDLNSANDGRGGRDPELPGEVRHPGDSRADSGSGGEDTDGATPQGGDDPELPEDFLSPPKGSPPDKTRGSCDDGVKASFGPGEIYVLSWDRSTDSGVLSAPAEGWYHVYNKHIAESGASQRNESAYFRVSNATHPEGTPRWGNCGDEWVIPDHDNGGQGSNPYIYVGTFWLDQGENSLVEHHYCPLYRSGVCEWMHITDDPGSTCDSGNANSVHFNGEALCVAPAN